MEIYVRHPAITDSRIIGYDTKNVTYKYEKISYLLNSYFSSFCGPKGYSIQAMLNAFIAM